MQTGAPKELELQSEQRGLEESGNGLGGIIQSAMDAIVTVDEQQKIVMFNPAAEKIFGLTAADALGRSLDQLLPGRFRTSHAQHVQAFGKTNLTRRRIGGIECLSGLRADGTEFPAEISISQAEVKGRRFFTAIVRDVTDRKRAENELNRKAEELARSNKDLEQFAYVASHDLQEPLRMVAAYTQLLGQRYRGQLGKDADQYIGHVVDGTARMQTLIQDLLAFSRAGSSGSKRENIEAGGVVDLACQNLKAAIEECGAIVTHSQLPAVNVEHSILIQLFQNLIGNALKFHGSSQPRISVSAERQGDEWVFSVADNGIGIAKEDAGRIFEIFQRLHTRSDYPGNGIGLAICKKIVEQHGGQIWVESEPGKGATFRFALPTANNARDLKEMRTQTYAARA